MYKKHQCPQCHVPSYFTIFKYLYENLLLLGKKSGKSLKNEKIKNNTCDVHYALVVSKLNPQCTCAASSTINPCVSQCPLSQLPENIRKPQGFLMFSGRRGRMHLEQIG